MQCKRFETLMTRKCIYNEPDMRFGLTDTILEIITWQMNLVDDQRLKVN